MNEEEIAKKREELWQDYQSSQVQGFFQNNTFEEFLVYMYDFVLSEYQAATKELREWEIKAHPQYTGDKR